MSIPVAERRQFKVGAYDVVAQPIPGSSHMLRYIVMLNGKRIGALASFPTESDCRFMEKPPVVPPLKPFVYYRPGRPKKGATPAPAVEPARHGISQDDIRSDTSLQDLIRTDESS